MSIIRSVGSIAISSKSFLADRYGWLGNLRMMRSPKRAIDDEPVFVMGRE